MHCRDCGATVERADRFCPACGTPNADTKFHPKFGPVPQGFEAEILYEVAAGDEPACLRCERRITDGARWCEGCGFDLRESWSRYRHRVAVERWERGETVPRPFRPAGRLGRGLRAALVVAAAGALTLAVTEVGAVEPTGVVADALAWRGSVAAGLLVLVTALFLAWSVRALGNLPALGVVDRRRSRRVLDDLWRAGAEDVELCSPTWRDGSPSPLARVWWGSVVAGAALVTGAALTGPSSALAAPLAGAAGAVSAASLLALLTLTRRIDERQAARAAALAPPTRRPVPDEVAVPVERASVELTASVPTRLEPLRTVPPDGQSTALNRPPSARRPVWGKY